MEDRLKAKSRTAGTSRRPPDPADSHESIDDWIGTLVPGLQPIVQHVDALIRATIPGLQFAIKWKKAYYGLPERGWVIELVAYDVSVNVVFLGGADFEAQPPLGDTDRSRYVKLTSLEDARRPELREWVKQAARVPGWS